MLYTDLAKKGITKDVADNLLTKLDGEVSDLENLNKILNSLGEGQNYSKLAEDLLTDAGQDLLRKLGKESVENGAGVVASWRKIQNAPEILRTNPKFLENIKEFPANRIDELNADLANPKWTDELTELFDESPDDVTNIWNKLKDDPDAHWELYDNDGFLPDGRWEKWSKREFFKEATAKGRKFEKEYLLPKFRDRGSPEYKMLKDNAAEKLGVNLDEFDMYSQVQLRYPKPITLPSGKVIEYFTADQVFIKWIDINGQKVIDDVVIIENKLKKATNLTPNQNAGKSASSLSVRSDPINPGSAVSGTTLQKNAEITVNNKWLKVYDSDTGDVIAGIDKI